MQGWIDEDEMTKEILYSIKACRCRHDCYIFCKTHSRKVVRFYMRDDEKGEIIRALDLLPHISGASWAMLWFRVNGIKNPSKDNLEKKPSNI